MAQAKMDFTINTKVDKTAFNDLKKEIQSLKMLSEKDLIKFGSASNFQEAKTQLASIQNSASMVEAALNKAFSPKLGTVSLSKFNNELKKINLKELATNFNKAGAAGNAAFRSLATNALTTKTQIKETNKLLDDMGQTLTNTVKWGLSSSAWNTVTGSFQKAYSYVQNLDKSLNNIRIVSSKSAEDMERFAIQANKAAKNLGATTLDYTNAALIYYQQGLSEKQVQERTNTTLKMANVLGTNAKEVSDYMTAIWNNFDDGTKSIEYYADVLAKLGAATASSAEEISTGLEKFAAIADTVGLSYEYATAALTTVTATTRQSAEVVGTAFKTLFARIQDLELGETLDDGTTLGKYSEALSKVGINIQDSNGNLKDMNDILDEMGSKWNQLSKAQQVSLAQTVAGTRQYTQLVALMDNWESFEQNLTYASNATGELNKQQAIYLESTQAHLDKLSASAERLYKNLIDSEGLNDLIDIFSGLVTGASEYVEAIGGSRSAMLQLGSIATKVFGRGISQSVASLVTNLKKAREAAEDFNAQAKLIQQFKGVKINDKAYDNLIKMATAMHEYKDVLSETQLAEGNALMAAYNEAENAKEMWEEAQKYAENYYKFFTEDNINLGQSFSKEQLDSYTGNLDEYINTYEQKLGEAKKDFLEQFENRDSWAVQEYVDRAHEMIQGDLVKNEQIKQALEKTLNQFEDMYTKADVSKEDRSASAQKFAEAYGRAADDIIKDTKEVKTIIEKASKGTTQAFKNNTEEASRSWDNFIDKIDVQSFAQNITDLSSHLFSIASAIDSIKSIPSIWENEDLSVGEKILQTMIAIGNAGRGVAAAYQFIHTAANIARAAQAKNIAGDLAQAGAIEKVISKQEDHSKAVEKTTEAYVTEKGAIKDTKKEIDLKTQAIKLERDISAEASQKEIFDETEFASRVATSTEMILEKNKALGNGGMTSSDGTMLQTVRDAMNHEVGKTNIQEFLESYGYKGRYSQLPTMTRNKLVAAGEDSKNAQKLAKTFKAIAGQGHAKARGELEDFNLENIGSEKDIKQLVDFLNRQLPSAQQDLSSVEDGLDKVSEAGKATEKTLDSLGGQNKKNGPLGGLKKDAADITKYLAGIPTTAYIVVAAIAAIAAVIYLIADAIETTKEKDERLRKQVEETTEAYNKATEAAQDLYSSINNYDSGIEGLKGLTEGTVEYYEAIVKANEAAQALIDKLGLIYGTDYTISSDGLIQINEDSLEKAAQEAQRETFRAQSAVYAAKAQEVRESSSGVAGAISGARNDINKYFRDQGANYSITDWQAERILQGKGFGSENVRPQEPSINNTPTFEYAGAPNDTLLAMNIKSNEISEKMATSLGHQEQSLDELISVNELNNQLTEQSAYDISDIVKDYIAKYNASVAQANQLELLAADQAIHGYGTESQKEAYKNATSTGQNLMQQYVARQMKNKSNKVKEIDSTASAVWGGLIGGAAGGATAGGLIGASGGTVVLPVVGTTIGTGLGAFLGGIGGAAAGAFGGYKLAEKQKKEQEEELKTIYAKEALGYTVNDKGDWFDEYNNLVSKSEKEKVLNSIDLTTATKAYETGAYYTDEALQKVQNQMTQNFGNARDAGFNEESARYISEAMTAAKQDLDYDYSILNEEEMAYFKEQIQNIGNATSTLDRYKEALNATSDAQKRLKLDTENYNTELQRQAQSLGTTEKALKLYHASLTAAGKAEKDLNKENAKAVGSTYKFNKAWNNAVDTFEKTEDAYDAWLTSLENGEEVSYDVADAVGEMQQSLEDTLGFEVDGDFLKNNSKLIKKFLSDNKQDAEAAYKELKRKALEATLLGHGIIVDNITAFTDELNSLNAGEQLSEKYSKQLTEMLQNTEMTKDELEKIFAEMHLEMPNIENEAEWEPVTYEQPGQTTVHHYSGDYPVLKNGELTTQEINYKWTETVDPQSFTYYRLKKDASMTYTSKGSSMNNTSFQRKQDTGKKGSTAKPKKEEKIKGEKDRYHDVNIELKQIQNHLEDIQRETERLTGAELIANLTEQIALLNKQIDTTAEKIRIAEGEMKELQDSLKGKGVKFAEDGSIANYAQIYDAQLAKVNKVIDKYNKMSAKQQEKYQETLDKAKEEWQEFLDDMARYDELLTEMVPELVNDIKEALGEQIELKLQAFEYEVKIRLDLSEARREWNDFEEDILNRRDLEKDPLAAATKNLKDLKTYYNQTLDENGNIVDNGEIRSTTTHINEILDQLHQMDADQIAGIYGATYDYINSKGEEISIDINDRAKALEDLKTYIDQIQDSIRAFDETVAEVYANYVDMIGVVQEGFNDQAEAYEMLHGMIQHDMELVKIAYGDEAYSMLSKLYDKELKVSKEKLDATSSQVDYWKQEVALQTENLSKLEKGTDEWYRTKEILDAAQESLTGAINAEMSEILAYMDVIVQEFLNNIDETFQALNKGLTEGLGLDYTNLEWDLINKNADEYLDTVNAIYSVQQLQNKYLDAIEKSTDPRHQKKLNDLMQQENKYLREKDKLTQYDLDRANLKYELALKQIALEEAQQNKNTMRLRRDSQGNYTYQYVADEDKVSSLQQEMSDLYNQLYNLDADQYKSNLEKITSLWAEAQEKMREAAQINDPTLRKEQEKLIEEHYNELITNLIADNETLKANLHQSTMSHLFDLYNENTENYSDMTEQQREILDQFISEETDLSNAAFDNMFNLYNENIEQFENMTKTQKDILMDSIIPQWESAYQRMIDTIRSEGGFEATMGAAFDTISEKATETFNTLFELEEKYTGRSEENQEYADSLIETADIMLDYYKEQMEQIKNVKLEVDKLRDAYKEAEQAAIDAAIAAKDYWDSAQVDNANGGKTSEDDLNTDKTEDTNNNNNNNTTNQDKASNGAPFKDTYTVKRGDTLSGIASIYGLNYKRIYAENKNVIGSDPDLIKPGMKLKIPAYQSGGYTGDWAGTGGQLAMLHKKELVLNASDTKNLLGAMDILRSITDNLGASLFNTISSISAHGASPAWANASGDSLQQDVHITAEFPNVTNSHEIEDALNNLVNHASQYIQK